MSNARTRKAQDQNNENGHSKNENELSWCLKFRFVFAIPFEIANIAPQSDVVIAWTGEIGGH